MKRFLQFGALSGFGWLCDLGILLSLLALGTWPFLANVVSSACAATAVFLISRWLVFDAAQGALSGRVVAYLIYTVGVILLASAVFAPVAQVIRSMAEWAGYAPTATSFAIMAKIAITPPQLFANYFVARFIAQRKTDRSDG